jgi:hypothetical protein
LRYGGYTTPGEKGDDIRVAAAQLMLAQQMPHAALDTLRQLAEPATSTPEVMRMRATAEAGAGDPEKAMELVRALPDDIAAHRIAARALHRMTKPLQAAHVLNDAATIVDREHRASLFFEAEAWTEAAGAYSNLLRDPALPGTMRDDLAKRYALSVAMTGEAANPAPPKLPDGPARLLAAVPAPSPGATGTSPSLAALREALDRARRIETLLDPATGHQGS